MVVPDDEYVEAMRVGVKLANSRGVTAVHDKDGWLGALRLWQQLEERGSLSLRVWQSIPHDQLDARRRDRDCARASAARYVQLGYLKVFMDGTLGSQTAWMLDGSGVQITSGAELAEIVRRGAAAGFPVAVHAIGDRANREALDAFEETRDLWQPQGLRQRIEHAQLLAPEDLPASPSSASPARCSSRTRRPTATSPTSYWAGKTDGAYAFRSLLDSGAVVANGSDAPIEELDPLAGHPRRACAARSTSGPPGIRSRR